MKTFTIEDVRNKLLEELHDGIRLVTFTKTNGDKRVMRCTLKKEILARAVRDDLLEETVTSTKRKIKSVDTLSVFDVDKIEWRSFRIDSVTMCIAE